MMLPGWCICINVMILFQVNCRKVLLQAYSYDDLSRVGLLLWSRVICTKTGNPQDYAGAMS